MIETVVRFFQEGGIFMYPIAVVLALGLAIAIERYIYLTVTKGANRQAFDVGVLPLLRKRDYKTALKYATQSTTAIGAIMSAGLARLVNQQTREDIEYALEEGLMETLPRLENVPNTWQRWLTYLPFWGSWAPLLV